MAPLSLSMVASPSLPKTSYLHPLEVKSGWVQGVRQVPTCRYGARPQPMDISLIVIHGISLPPGHFGGPYVDEIFLNTLDPKAHPYFAQVAGMEVSTHFFINRAGRITQYVSCLDRAWHAGRSQYQGRAECNDYGIGIELEGTDTTPYTKEQYHSLRLLIVTLQQAYPQIGGHIAGHSDIAPTRKTDPGPSFAWEQIADLR